MKNILLFSLLFLNLNLFCQASIEDKSKDDYDLFISAGLHAGLWALVFNSGINTRELPYNVHIDKALNKKYAIGLGYSYDVFDGNPNRDLSNGGKSIRQNIRIRFCKFMNDHEQTFCPYIGASAGLSYWKTLSGYHSSDNNIWPTAQFIFGVKVKLGEALFWQTELGAGPPYALQSSIGIKF